MTDLAAGAAHVLALRSDHRVWSWGDNTRGQLGLPAAVSTPTQVRGTLYAYAIAAGGQSSIAIGQPS